MKGNYDPKKEATSGATEGQKKKMNKSKEKKIIEKQRQKYTVLPSFFFQIAEAMYVFFFLRLLDWDDRPEIVRQKHEKVVVIKNIFSPNDFNVKFFKINFLFFFIKIEKL